MDPIPVLVSKRGGSSPGGETMGGETILRSKDRGIWKSVTWAELDARVREIGTALLAADFGRGDVVAILSETRAEAVYADLAVLGCGAASVAIDPDEAPDRVGTLLASGGVRLAFVENEEQLDKVLGLRGRCPALSRIVVFDMKGLRDFADAGCVSLAEFVATCGVATGGAAGDSVAAGGGVARGAAGGAAAGSAAADGPAGGRVREWAEAVRAITADQPAVIQFPRGESMGRTLTHGDLVHMVSAARDRLPLRPKDERLVVLRLSDITERVWGLYLALETGCISNYPEGPDTVIENLQELQPTVLGADAAAWGHLYGLASARAKAATAAQRLAYGWAVRAGRLGGSLGRLADLLVLQAVRREFGLNRLRLGYVGGAPVAPGVLDWARSLGISIQRVDEAAGGAGQLDERYRALLENAYA